MNEEQMQKQADIMDPQEVLGLMREVQELRLERDNLADRLGLRIGERNTAETHLGEAIVMLHRYHELVSTIDMGSATAPVDWCAHFRAEVERRKVELDQFLSLHTQTEQQEEEIGPLKGVFAEAAEQVFQEMLAEGEEPQADEARLRLLAGKATQGDWWIDSHGHRMMSQENFETIFITHSEAMGPATRNQETGNLSHWRNDWDCSYIVAVQPKAILKLLNKLEVAYDLLASVPQHGPLAYPRFASIQQFLKTRPVSEGSI